MNSILKEFEEGCKSVLLQKTAQPAVFENEEQAVKAFNNPAFMQRDPLREGYAEARSFMSNREIPLMTRANPINISNRFLNHVGKAIAVNQIHNPEVQREATNVATNVLKEKGKDFLNKNKGLLLGGGALLLGLPLLMSAMNRSQPAPQITVIQHPAQPQIGQPVQPFSSFSSGGVFQKSSSFLPSPFELLAAHAAGSKAGRSAAKTEIAEQTQEYNPRIISKNKKIQKLLENPEFREYVENLIKTTQETS